MKKTLLFLLAGVLIAAQNTSQLLNTNWYISQISIGTQATTTPIMDQSLQPSEFMFVSDNYVFNSKYFNSSVVPITFSTTADSFSKTSSGGCTLLDYWGNNMAAVQTYDQKNCDFYGKPVGHVFNYQVIPNGSGKTLIITDSANGDKIYYNSFFLENKEVSGKNPFLISQNPVKEKLIMKNLEKGLSFQIVDVTGHVIFEGKTSVKETIIDIGSIVKGQYFLIVQGRKPQKFIKE
ncbi:hypothetical protein [Chryseobacterium taichungense]|uniref:hypothetical protein n=1 Tax=Chryseobacterium taichungense TaxID=295069 RepID=UPI0028AF1C9C|nr:hypothetical protein [Chryseobacterium taichungense]